MGFTFFYSYKWSIPPYLKLGFGPTVWLYLEDHPTEKV